MDQHYGAEWELLSRTNPTATEPSRPYLTYRPAFSRDNPEGVKRTYVQDLLDEDREEVWDMVGRRGGWVYISGCVGSSHIFSLLSYTLDWCLLFLVVLYNPAP